MRSEIEKTLKRICDEVGLDMSIECRSDIENLEAIAAGEPEDFKTGAGAGLKEIEIEETDHKEENKQKVSNLADKRRSQ